MSVRVGADPAETIREAVARELFVAWRSEGGWSGSRDEARETWSRRTPKPTMDDWRKRAEVLIETLAASGITLMLDTGAASDAR